MKKQNFLFILLLTAFFACKNDTKSGNTQTETTDKEKVIQSYKDNEIENALYTGYFVKSENGFDAIIKDNTLYLLKNNPTDDQKNNHFFLHILPKNGKEINMDFAPSEFRYNDQLSDKFAYVLVYKRELPEIKGPFDINVGQIDGKIWPWSTYIIVDKLDITQHRYNNEYLEFVDNNWYLKEFESALNEGYFMKHQEGFDLLLNNHTLYYIKVNGRDSDLSDMFFLHVKYDNKNEIFNFDFNGKPNQINDLLGRKFQNFIIVKKELPNTGKIIEIDTGQFDKSKRSWSVVYQIEQLYDNMNYIYDDQYRDIIQKKN